MVGHPALRAHGKRSPAPTPRRLTIIGDVAVIDQQQRRLHEHAHALGFTDLGSYLMARCQDDASVARLASELDTTVHVIRRLIDEAGIHPPHGRPAGPASVAAPPTSISPSKPPSSVSLACRPIWLTA